MTFRLASLFALLYVPASRYLGGLGVVRARAVDALGAIADLRGFGRASRDRRDNRSPRRPRWPWVAFACCILVVYNEVRTSALQAWVFSRWAGDATFSVQPGSGEDVVYPRSGPLNERLGYTRLPDYRERLEQRGFGTVEQARFSPALSRLARWGVSPPFREPAEAGLVIRDAAGEPLFDFARRRPRFERFEDIPLVVIRTLLHMEDRHLEDPSDPRSNPAVNWPRLVGAGARYVGKKMGLPLRIEGGSTLATQMEKYRHSPGGRTESPLAKLKQMTAASLRAYRDGPDATLGRRQIILDYLNSMPLSAAPGYGEVSGLPEGLRVWFGLDPEKVRRELESPGVSDTNAAMFKQVVALLYAVRAPSWYLTLDRTGLEQRADAYIRLLSAEGLVSRELAERALAVPLVFPRVELPAPPPRLEDGKAVTAIRNRLVGLLGTPDLYALDRLHVDVTTTIDADLQRRVAELLRDLADPAFVRASGLVEARMLQQGDPSRVVYSLMLMEATERGNLVRVHSDTLRGPFDINAGTKMELGSTAKLRTLTHYLDVVASLHEELSTVDRLELRRVERTASDPLTHWVAWTLRRETGMTLEALLDRALDRRYSASPRESFFTGGGRHTFSNFDPRENLRTPTVREATVHSTNLVFIRLMRDLVRYHESRLPYDARTALERPDDPTRAALLESIADDEARAALFRAWTRFREPPPAALPAALLGRRADSAKHLAILYFAWHPDGDERRLRPWLYRYAGRAAEAQAPGLARAYGGRRLAGSDYGWLLDRHPLDVWCAGRLFAAPGTSWDELLSQSDEARRDASAWLFKTKNRRAQETRLRERFERDAFDRMTAHWQRLGFPFERMVPSYASAIGSSADRPAALADLMGVIVNDGVRRPATLIDEIRLAPGTPYYAALSAERPAGERVLAAAVARAVRRTLAGVAEGGTARRVKDAFELSDGSKLVVGGKTGSGDNRHDTFAKNGQLLDSRAVSRTAAFVFYVGDRYYGIVTASVAGPDAADYSFTSSLPLAVLRLLAPAIAERAAQAASAAA